MLKLHGFCASNYVNIVKLALLEKGADYQFITQYPKQDKDTLATSPMGKMPTLETEHGFLAETQVILEYIDQVAEGPALFPQDPFQRAHVKQIIHMLEIYIELPARRCYAEVFFGGKVSDETKQQTIDALLKGARALARVTDFSPYIAGAHFTAADVFFLYSFELAANASRKLSGPDLFAEAPGAAELLQRLQQRDTVKQVAADREASMADFMAYVSGK